MVKGEISELEQYNDLDETTFAEYDRVTLLPSVDVFKNIVKNNIKNSIINNTSASLILFDIDNFKHVNDSFGHEFGDSMLRIISSEVRNSINREVLMCRYSGNTFILFQNSESEIEKTIEEIFNVFKQSHEDIYLTISMGISVVPKDGISYDFLLKNADIAMYEAKQNGKNNYKFFSNEMGNKVVKEYALQKELRTSLENNEIYVVYQPKVSLEDSTVQGFEALARWNNKKFGEISPGKFIPLAEESKMIVPIGSFVLEEACRKIKFLSSKGYTDFKIAVNLSEVQFQEEIVINVLRKLIKKYQISSRHLELEITESMFMKSFESNLKVLEEIKDMGITIALDDFGTGYSSFSYLTKLPIDVLKIDRSFILDVCTNPKEKCMVEGIIRLAHQLGIQVVAEGVEEEEQVEYLKAIFCDFVQGYYFSRPKPFNEIIDIVGKKYKKC
ncbi:bifunctional diguanylate cyclase/phosphodiesterase [uncultured Clostridium sp.]|uniref:putative bifunctional diguanylate cyclase/phosphodiesterase n=1 Tax=uncultured Clostridium sp. TaxID=59620 RepID=UPI0025E67C86|nr:bifunctional diguanylate cyclase/phosphodiesterase [uncultured Clostridium sp.]